MEIKKHISLLNNAIVNEINHFSLRGKSKLVGSNSLRGLLFASDIDVNTDIINITPKLIVKYLQIACLEMENTHLIEFKAGFDKNGNKLRWTKADIKKGVLKGINLEDAILQKSIVKLDLIIRVGNTYEEVSINYFIKIGTQSNFNKQTKEEIQLSLEEDINEYYKSNVLKSIKRLYSALRLDMTKNKIKFKKMETFFNSSVGLENKIKNEINTLLQVIDLEPWKNIYNALQGIKQELASLYAISSNKLIAIDFITKATATDELEGLIEYLQKKINKQSLEFLKSL
jgi:hypothetical protein